MRVRDFQRARVYRWERSQKWWSEGGDSAASPMMSLRQCHALVKRATERYRCYMPVIHDGRGNRNATGSSFIVKLPRWARTAPVVLHETAHVIDAQRGIYDKHGPAFVRLYIQLLATYMKLDEKELVQSAKAARVRVAGRQPVRRG